MLIQSLNNAISHGWFLSEVAELREPSRGLCGFKLAFAGHPIYCLGDGPALELSLSLPARLAQAQSWNMVGHLPWTRCIGLPLVAAHEYQDRQGNWVALGLQFASPVDAGLRLQIIAGQPVQLWVETDTLCAPSTPSTSP